MTLGNMNNERVKKRFIERQSGAKGYSEASIIAIERAIWSFEKFTRFEDFKSFSRTVALNFRTALDQPGKNGKPAPVKSQYQVLRHLREFFFWLADQPGYRSRIRPDDIEYLNLDKKRTREALSPVPVDFPSLEYVQKLASSIQPVTDIDLRDRALIAMLLLSGMRDSALVSLPIGCFDPDRGEIRQLPQAGVHTKFGKAMTTFLFPFDETLKTYVVDWYRHLQKDLIYSSGEPLFPKTRMVVNPSTGSFATSGLEPAFWSGTGPLREILKRRAEVANLPYFHPHTFRHAATHLAFKYCVTTDHMRAVSQNLGHENLGTTIQCYAKLRHDEVRDLISTLNPDNAVMTPENQALFAQFIKMVNNSNK